MTGRLPKGLRERAAHDRQSQPPADSCPDCDGEGVRTISRERAGYLDEDIDLDCSTCDGTGLVRS